LPPDATATVAAAALGSALVDRAAVADNDPEAVAGAGVADERVAAAGVEEAVDAAPSFLVPCVCASAVNAIEIRKRSVALETAIFMGSSPPRTR
jgi:hypothetical protein